MTSLGKRFFEADTYYSQTDMPAKVLKSSKSLLKGKVARPKTTSGVVKKKRGAITRSEVAKIAKAVVYNEAETKYLDTVQTGQTVAQVNYNSTGHNSNTLGYPSAGDAYNQREGNKIKLISLKINSQYWGQAGLSSPMKIVTYLVWFPAVQSADVTIRDFMDVNACIEDSNPAADVTDCMSMVNQQNQSNFKVIAAWETYLPRLQNVSEDAGNNVSTLTECKEIPLNLVQTFDVGTGNALNSLTLYTIANVGNRNAASASTLSNIAMVNVSTGANFCRSIRMMYKDI